MIGETRMKEGLTECFESVYGSYVFSFVPFDSFDRHLNNENSLVVCS